MAEKPEDLNLPTSAVTRIIRDAIPDGVNVSKDAKTAINRAASIFVLYATACANTHALKAKRKTILPNDLFQALSDMELEEFVPELKTSLEVYRKDQKDKKQAAATRKQQKAANEDKTSSVNNDEIMDMDCDNSTAEEPSNVALNSEHMDTDQSIPVDNQPITLPAVS